jgi:murein DD-endopeptidase MepM/ murein hydrolase activator NlpD
MRFRPVFPALAVALAVTAALGPPATAAPGEGGGTAVPTSGGSDGGGGGGAAYGQPAPRPKHERRAKRSTRVKRTAPGSAGPGPGEHRFPLAGPFAWGGDDARFGARRQGHRHQGQDLAAALGTPVVAPRGGAIEAVGYQARGAGHYVVLDGEGEDLDYVFMHLRRGSIGVRQGESVAIGRQLGEVGNTGRSFGPHLHFEIWVGGWFAGGHPIDPLPLLQAWSGV